MTTGGTDVPLLLVDGHNMLWRAAFGTPAEILSRDRTDRRDLTAHFMFFALVRKAINTELGSPWPEVIVVFDGEHGAAGRQQTDADYKANRSQDPAALKPILALPDVKAGLDLFGISWVEIEDAEADDVIATLSAGCPSRNALVMSADQDYYQLLTDHGRTVRVLSPGKRPGQRLLGPAHVRDRFGVAPQFYPDLRALCGDSSDNIPGVRGIGPKSAAALLSGGLSLEDLPNSGRLVGGKGAAVRATWPQLLTWRSMIRMRTDLPLPLGPTGQPTTPLPAPGEVITKLGLWWREPAARPPGPP